MFSVIGMVALIVAGKALRSVQEYADKPVTPEFNRALDQAFSHWPGEGDRKW